MSGVKPWALLSERRPNLDEEGLEAYAAELCRWNRAIRLVGPKDLDGIRVQIADALLPFLLVPPEFPLLDIGSGAGLPGIPIAIAFAGGTLSGSPAGVSPIVCLEPNGKRASFLRHAARHRRLSHVGVVEARAEEACGSSPELRGAFRTVTARAVAEPEAVLALAAPFLAAGGRVVLPRGEEEAARIEGWRLCLDLPYRGPEGVGGRRVLSYAPEAG